MRAPLSARSFLVALLIESAGGFPAAAESERVLVPQSVGVTHQGAAASFARCDSASAPQVLGLEHALPSIPRGGPSSDLRWAELGPPARAAQTAVFDPKHRRLIVFGGRIAEKYRGAQESNDVWVLSLDPEPRWHHVIPLGEAPSPRSECAGVFDSSRERMVLFGGQDSSGFLNDVWELSLIGRPKWRRLHPAGEPPSPRYRHTATLDPANDRMLVFAGWDGWYTDDLWQLDLSRLAWSRLQPEGPVPPRRAAHTTVFAPDRNGLIVFGGAGPVLCPYPYSCAQNTTDVWFLSLSDPPTWTNLTPLVTVGARPCGIQHHAAVYDPVGERMVVIGGYGAYGYDTGCFGGIASVWLLSLRELRWSELPSGPDGVGGRYFSSALYDPEQRRILVYGGGGGTPYADVWALALGPGPSWSKLAPAGGLPAYDPYASSGRLHYDDRGDRLLTLAGSRLWSYSFRDGNEWTSVETQGERPPSRWGSTEILDPVGRRLILHGGSDGRSLLGGTWQLSLDDPPMWSRLAAGGEDPAVLYGAATYDPIRERMILTGGYRDSWQPSAEVWCLSLQGPPQWSRLDAEGSWFGRAGHSAIYDERGDRLVVVGGGGDDADSWYTLNDVWALSLSDPQRWTQLSPNLWGPDAPYPRAFQGALHDPVRNRMVMVGGWVPGAFARGPFDDAWEFALDVAEWRLIAPEEAVPLWRSPAGAYDSRRRRFLFNEYHWLWALQSGGGDSESPRSVAEATLAEGAHLASRPSMSLAIEGSNPFSEGIVAEVSLPEAAPALMELFDVAGRRVWSQETRFNRSGSHLVRVAGLTALSPGVYLLRLTQARQSRVVRVVHSR